MLRDALAVYRTLLRDDDDDVVLLALEGLGQFGAEAGPAVAGLRPPLQHADACVRSAAAVRLDLLDRR